MITRLNLRSREEWLKTRSTRIGGSDAAAVIGLNPWMSNVDLWEIKTGRRQQEDISQKEAVSYGTKAEEHLRALFALDYPSMKVYYEENNLFLNDRYPWAHVSLDGWLEGKEGKRGVLEIKTTTVSNLSGLEKWKGKLPDNYFCQVLHEMAVYEAEFAIISAQIKRSWLPEEVITRRYILAREDVEEDIKLLMEAEEWFYECVKQDRRPDLILPEI